MQMKKGISLIVLVITIIVMVVLAGAIILTLNNSGIIQKANDAVDRTNEATVKELASLAWAESYADGERSQGDLEKAVLETLEQNKIDVSKYKIVVTTSGVDVKLKANIPTQWQDSIIDIVDTVPIPKGFVASDATGENTKNRGLVIYEGTEAVTNANVETARRSRNQYVWVPVDSTKFDTEFVRNSFGEETLGEPTDEENGIWEPSPNVLGSSTPEATINEVQEMYASVKKYGGFYIARYEAGTDQLGQSGMSLENLPGIKDGLKVYSAMGKMPYVYIGEAMITVARNMYTKSDNNFGVVSTLVYGVQWDRAVQWLIDTNAITLAQANGTDSTGKNFGNYYQNQITKKEDLNAGAKVLGNFRNDGYDVYNMESLTYPLAYTVQQGHFGWALSTGALKSAKINNIYDMAGNMLEATMEQCPGGTIIRGGLFAWLGDEWQFPLASRFLSGSAFSSGHNTSFRTALYIK